MKFNVEINIDWIDEERNLDEAIQEEIIGKLTKNIQNEFAAKISKQIALSAENLVRAKTELIINSTLEKPITITEGWNKSTEYPSVYEMVEQRMTKLYEGRLGGNNTCEKDPLLGNIENYVDKQVKTLLIDVQRRMEVCASNAAKKAVDENDLLKVINDVVNT